MFGRKVKVTIENDDGDLYVLVNPEHRDNALRVKCDMEVMPTAGGAPRLTMSIYNLDPNLRGVIRAKELKNITVEFGYDDVSGGQMFIMFRGQLARMIVQRPEADTSVSIFYVYGAKSMFRHGWFSGVIPAGTSYYDAMTIVATKQVVPTQVITPIFITEKMREYFFEEDTSVYGAQIDIINEWAVSKGAVTAIDFGNIRVIDPSDPEKITVLAAEDGDGVVRSMSGLIGIPSMENDGVNFKCLVNPDITLYSYVYLPNSIISDNQTGFESSASAGAMWDVNGYYRVVEITASFGNGPEESSMSCRALAVTENGEQNGIR